MKDLAVSEMERSFTTFRMTKNVIHSNDKWGFWNYAELSDVKLCIGEDKELTFWVSMLLVLVIDQLSKFWVMTALRLGESRPFIDNLMNITYVHNPGAAFSILAGQSWISLICAAAVVGAIFYYVYKYKPVQSIQFFLGIIAGGAIGNFMDRFLYSYVRDFFDLGWFPVFNVADIGIVCGGILLVIYILFIDGSEEKDERD